MVDHAGSLGPGAIVGPYRIVRELGKGGMGAVYEAEDGRVAGRRVALKVLLGEAGAERFAVEARATARLSHPNLVKVHEAGAIGARAYIAMEYVEGRPLDAVLKAGPLAPLEAARITRDMARALAYAHGQGILHRDLKPANVLLTPEGVPRLTDFGLAKAADASQVLTRTGDLLGTPSYMAPEQADGRSRAADARVDVYGLGATLYCLLTGRAPFTASSLPSLLTQVLSKAAAPPSTVVAAVPPALDAVCLRCLEKDPVDRYPDMSALADALDQFLEGDLTVARPPLAPWVVLGLGVVTVAVGAGALWIASGQPATAPTPETSTVAAKTRAPAPTPQVKTRSRSRSRKRSSPSPSPSPSKSPHYRPSRDDLGFLLRGVKQAWVKAASTGPRARTLIQYAMAYDAHSGVVWLFGGRTLDGFERDLWRWDGATWTEVRPREGQRWPEARANHTLTYDPERRRLVLWGGRKGPRTKLQGDVWELDPARSQWVRLEHRPGWPDPRSHAAGAYDTDRKRVLIFGGKTRKGLNRELWEWDGETWRAWPERGTPRPPPQGPELPSPRSCAGLSYGAKQRRVLLYGGQSGHRTFATLWSHDGERWRKERGLANPGQYGGSRTGHSWTAADGRVVLFGGRVHRAERDAKGDYKDGHYLETGLLWNRAWYSMVTEPTPRQRSYHGAAYDSQRRRVVVFGGSVWRRRRKVPDQLYGDTWEYPVEGK